VTDHPGLPDGVRTMSSMTPEEARIADHNIEVTVEWANTYLGLMHEHMEEAHADEHPFCSPLCMSIDMINMIAELSLTKAQMIISVLMDHTFKQTHGNEMVGVPDEHGGP